jgi:hypothetical protein
MKIRGCIVLCGLALLSAGAHAETKVTDRDEIVTGKISKPAHIWVYDFAATAADLPADSAVTKQNEVQEAAQTPEEVAMGRQLGADIASQLVQEIQAMGLPAEHPAADTKPDIDDLVIRGQLLSFSEGSEKKRVLIGLGAGESELQAAVQGYQVTDNGLRRLGTGSAESTAGKTPGIGVGALTTVATHNPLGLIVSTGIKRHDAKKGTDKLPARAKDTAKKIADVLRERFKEQGWIDGN